MVDSGESNRFGQGDARDVGNGGASSHTPNVVIYQVKYVKK